MNTKWIETLTGSLEQKKQYKHLVARIAGLPAPYGATGQAFQRYFLYYGEISDGDKMILMLQDFADLWERAATDGTPVRDIIGDDPVAFAEDFVLMYRTKSWIDKERKRLVSGIDAALRDTGQRP